MTRVKVIDPDKIADDMVQYREDDHKIITVPKDASFSDLIAALKAKKKEQETVVDFHQSFKFRPYDGAVATAIVLKSRYGIVMGKEIVETNPFTGKKEKHPPAVLDVPIGPGGKSIQVPWGRIQVPTIDNGDVYLGTKFDDDYGQIFRIKVKAKKLYAKEIGEFFHDVWEQLRNASIYRGKAVAGADSLTFIEDLDKFNASQIVFNETVRQQLAASLFSPLRHPQSYRQEGISLKRAVLLYGPYGTGKTSVGMMLAQEAIKAGWTYIMARPGQDRVQDVLTTARLYAPAVVWVEDIDTDTGESNPKAVSEMLDAFDGINSKQGEIVIAMSTNHIDRVPPGMLRPGRLDYVIEIAALDRAATARLIQVVVPAAKLGREIDYDAVFEAVRGFQPAFVRATMDRARSLAMHRINGGTNYVLTTEDMVAAAKSLQPQQELHEKAQDAPGLPTVDAAFRNAVTQAVNGVSVKYPDGERFASLGLPAGPSRS